MAGTLLLLLLSSYVVMSAVFMGLASRPTRYAKWFGLVALAAAAPLFFWMGAFAESFSAGQCYTGVVDRIANAVETTDSPASLASELRALPMRGYETDCGEVENAARLLPDAVGR